MTDLSKINAAKFVETHKLNELITLGDTGIYTIPADLHELVVLKPLGITSEQYNKIEKAEEELMAGVTHQAGQLALDYFKNNAESVELGFSYQQGKSTTVNGIFNREAKDHTVLSIETKYKTADMKRVLNYFGDSLANINS